MLLVAVALLAGVGVVGVVVAVVPWRPTAPPAPAPAQAPASAAEDGAGSGRATREPSGTRRDPRARQLTAARQVLRRWDERRSAAYAHGSLPDLRRSYTTGSTAGRRDLDLLRGYLLRGYRIQGMRTQVLALRVLDHGRDRWVLLVTDRLQAAVAVGRDQRTRLPADAASTRRVTMVRSASRWQMSTVSDVHR